MSTLVVGWDCTTGVVSISAAAVGVVTASEVVAVLTVVSFTEVTLVSTLVSEEGVDRSSVVTPVICVPVIGGTLILLYYV